MEDHDPEKSTLLLTGYIRAHGLSVNQLVSLWPCPVSRLVVTAFSIH